MSNSVLRALEILELLSKADRPMALTPIAEQLGIPKSTAHTILRALVSREFLVVSEHASYSIGLKAFEIGAAHLRSVSALDIVTPQLVELTHALGVTSHYAILDATDAVYLVKEDPPGLGIKLASSVGARLPAHVTAVGKASLAWLPEDEIAGHLPADVGTGPGSQLLDGFAEQLAKVRQQGFSVDDGDTAAGVRCIAAPVFNPAGPPGAIGVSYLLGSPLELDAAAAQVVQAAERSTAQLGKRTSR
ncbi:IclR family transcriptional regulator [Arthrobacter sp. NPDC089319]|uniref:IclR family transcriptional regulator n=1 Tax=Arthrobacter sp. NPDC089319 TaxID=3155915 RepID=UPI003422E4B4